MSIETQGTHKKCDISIIKEEAFVWHIRRLRIRQLGQRRIRVHRSLRQLRRDVVAWGRIGLSRIYKIVEGDDGQFSPKCWRQHLWEIVRVSFQLHTGKTMIRNYVWAHLARKQGKG